MKARLIPDNNMFGLRIAVRQLLEKTATQLQADGRKKLELGQSFHHLHRPINVFPLVALFLSRGAADLLFELRRFRRTHRQLGSFSCPARVRTSRNPCSSY